MGYLTSRSYALSAERGMLSLKSPRHQLPRIHPKPWSLKVVVGCKDLIYQLELHGNNIFQVKFSASRC
jgi:hypothetical protein